MTLDIALFVVWPLVGIWVLYQHGKVRHRTRSQYRRIDLRMPVNRWAIAGSLSFLGFFATWQFANPKLFGWITAANMLVYLTVSIWSVRKANKISPKPSTTADRFR